MNTYFHEEKHYYDLSEKLSGIVALIAIDLQRYNLSSKQKLHLNFMAKAVTTLKGIHALWESECFQECYVLDRCMSDRLFHLQDLIDNDSYQDFEDYTFVKMYKTRDKIKGSTDSKEFKKYLSESSENRKKFHELSKGKLKYQRPKIEDVAKRLDMKFLYDQGYNLKSSAVHPMFDDGERELKLMLNPNYMDQLPDNRDILHNSLFYAVFIVKMAMMGLGYKWRTPVVDFLDQAMNFLSCEDNNYLLPFMEIIQYSKDNITLSDG